MRALIAGIGVALAIASSGDAQSRGRRPVEVQFGCDGQAGAVCYFNLVNDGAVRAFTIPAGSKKMIWSNYVGEPFYVSIDYPNHASAAVCQKLVSQGRFCQMHYVKPGYNN